MIVLNLVYFQDILFANNYKLLILGGLAWLIHRVIIKIDKVFNVLRYLLPRDLIQSQLSFYINKIIESINQAGMLLNLFKVSLFLFP